VTTVDLSYNQLRQTGNQYVYFRSRWENSWALAEAVHCIDATWCLSPTMPTATLVFDYGHCKPQFSRVYLPYSKSQTLGWYVKIVMQTDVAASETITWYGVVSHVEDEQMGVVESGGTRLATGRQLISCYGLPKILDTDYIAESWVDDGESDAPRVVQLPVTFNRSGRPNRNTRLKLKGSSISYVFDGQSHVQYKPEYWSTCEIVKYLLTWVPPKDGFTSRENKIPFDVIEDWNLSNKDRPQVEQEGHTIASILNRLIDRRRLRAYYLTVDETTSPHTVQLRIAPWNASEIDTGIDTADVLLANANQIDIICDYNQSTGVMLRTTDMQRYDRIVIRGARRTSTATFVVDEPGTNPAGLARHWTTAEETAYEDAASVVAGYGGWDLLEQQQRNAEVRGSDKLSAVYSWFHLPDNWKYLVRQYDSASVTHPVFILDDDTVCLEELIHEVVFEPFVPLWEHVDYSGTIIEDETAADPPAFVYRQPSIYFKVPTDDRWVDGNAIATLGESSSDPAGDGGNFRWSASVKVQPDTRTLEVQTDRDHKHVIAFTDFQPLAEDRDLGDFDYRDRKMTVTATVRDNRYAEAVYPPESLESSLIDMRYGYTIYAGDDFRQDYVVPKTIIDIATDGTVITSDGGYVRDDTDILKALARVTYEWWSQERTILTLVTSQLTSQILPGYFIVTLGDPDEGHFQTVNTLVSQLRITWPLLEGDQLDMPRMEIVTGAGELDPMTMVPKEPRAISRGKARVRR
jgi:hypothetical protein